MRRIALTGGTILFLAGAAMLAATGSAPASKLDQPASKPTSRLASKPATTSAPATIVLLADVVSWKDKKATIKFHLDEAFDKYAVSQFKYPRELGLKNAQVGEYYMITFQEELALHVHKSAQLVDPVKPPALGDKSLIGKVVAIEEKAAVIEWNKDDAIRKFFSKEQVFGVGRANADFTPGEVIRVKFGADNRHCDLIPLVVKKK